MVVRHGIRSFLQKADTQNKQQKFIERNARSGFDQSFFVSRKMDGFDGKIALGKLISVAYLLCDDFRKKVFFGERRFYQSDHLLFGKTFVQRIDRLKRVLQRLIILQRIDLRVLQLQTFSLLDDPPVKNVKAAFLQHIS